MSTQPLPEKLPADELFAFDGNEECFDEIEDAVRYAVECEDGATIAQCIEQVEWPITVDVARRLPKPTPERMLERLLDEWHEDFGDPNGEGPAPTPEMLAAMKTIADALPVWSCETTGRAYTVTKEQAKAMLEGEE